jgi:hypothetical protein
MNLWTYLALMEGLRLDLPLFLKTVNNILVTPANLVRQTLDKRENASESGLQTTGGGQTDLYGAVFPARLQPEHSESCRDDHTLLPVIWRRDTLEELQAVQSSSTTGGLVGDHSADCLEENLGRRAVMERARLFGINNVTLV